MQGNFYDKTSTSIPIRILLEKTASRYDAPGMRFLLLLLLSMPLMAQAEKSFSYKPPTVGVGIFTELEMLDKEREEYATSLAAYACNTVVASEASAASLADARRYLALALHLNPRNKQAVVVNYQLSKGIAPAKIASPYSPATLASLLLSRGQLLVKEKAEKDQLLGRIFITVAAELDSKNDDAVYESEMLRLDHKNVDWAKLTDVKVEAEKSHE